MIRQYKLTRFPDPRPFLHIRCGDDILDKLAEAGIPGDRIRWADVLCEGPLHHHASDQHRQKERAAYISARYGIPLSETYRGIKGEDQRVDQCVNYDETVLWFEADLYDQAILVYLLARLSAMAEQAKLSLICIGSFPGVRRFIGLGQLSPAQLATLLPLRERVTTAQFELARETWEAFNAPDPIALSHVSLSRSAILPFLPAAVRRYLAEYPSTRNGLSQTEQWALEAVARGAKTPAGAFGRVQRREPRPFMGDSMFYAVIRGLAQGEEPALEGEHPRFARLRDPELRRCPVRLTATGRQLLLGKADWCRLSGFARSIGGVHFRGAEPRWRWDAERRQIVEHRPRL